MAAAHDVTLVEGAGGLLVPILAGATVADLAARLEVQLVVVVGSKLGAINHTLLTLRHAQSLGLRVRGYIVNFLSPEPDLAARTNVEVLTEWCGAPLGVVPYVGTPALTEEWRRHLAEVATAHIRLADLLVPC
jgi:dethiobiotin synthetase